MLKHKILVQRWRNCKCGGKFWKETNRSVHRSRRCLRAFLNSIEQDRLDALYDDSRNIHFCAPRSIGKPRLVTVWKFTMNILGNLIDDKHSDRRGFWLEKRKRIARRIIRMK